MESAITEQEHQLLLDAIKEHAIFMIDPGGHIMSWNVGAKRLKGYEEDEVLGKHFRILFLPEDQSVRPENEMKTALQTGKFEDDWWRLKKDGSKFWAHIILQPVFDDNQEHIGFVKITADLSEQKRMQELNDFLMNEMSDFAIFLLDRKGHVIKWSKAAENMAGFNHAEVLGRSLSFLCIGDTEAQCEGQVQKDLAEAKEGRYEGEGWRRRKDGSTFWANYVITPLHNQNGYVVLIRDNTDKRAAEQQTKANASLADSHKQLERFAFVASHHLREPVRKITLFAQMLKPESLQQEKLVRKIVSSCTRVGDLLDDILELSFVTHHKPLVQQDLNFIIQQVIDSLDEEILEKQAIVTHNDLPTAPVIPVQIEQLLYNLVSNALKFCCSENEVPRVFVEGNVVLKEELSADLLDKMIHSDSYLQLTVQDNGIGFNQEYSSNIFNLFDRLHTNQEYTGTGVGLSICKRVVVNHGGNISAISEPGKGTLFIITIPYYKP